MKVGEKLKQLEKEKGLCSVVVVDELKKKIGQAVHDGEIMMAYRITTRTANNKKLETDKEITKVEKQETECALYGINGYAGKSKFIKYYIHVKRLTKGNDYIHKTRIEYEPIKNGAVVKF